MPRAGTKYWTLGTPLPALPVNAYDVTADYNGDATYAMATGVGNFAINNGSNRYDNFRLLFRPGDCVCGTRNRVRYQRNPKRHGGGQIPTALLPSGAVTLTAAPNFQGGTPVTVTGTLSGADVSIPITLRR